MASFFFADAGQQKEPRERVKVGAERREKPRFFFACDLPNAARRLLEFQLSPVDFCDGLSNLSE